MLVLLSANGGMAAKENDTVNVTGVAIMRALS